MDQSMITFSKKPREIVQFVLGKRSNETLFR